jgi:Tol biopolymer transport system component
VSGPRALNHPNIAAIYGFEEADDVHALVLELVEGPTLAEHLRRAPVPIVEAVLIAHQVADALESAHEKGIVHRDLKPANIKVTDGRVKVLDFGLAKAAAAGPQDVLQAPTVSDTHEGTILGTASYMSPEQARGQAVDKRTDIWAFGCVLYEMLTGRAAFARGTTSDTIAAILEQEVDLSKLPATTPPGIRRLLPRCLAKDRKQRLRDIGDAHADLDDARPMAAPAGVTGRARISQRTRHWGLALVVGLATGGLAMWFIRSAPVQGSGPAFSRAFRLTTTPAHEFGPAISPDGKWVAYLSDARGPTDVWVKFTAGGEPANLTASAPLDIQVRSAIGGLDISPDGSSIAVQARPSGSTAPTFDMWLIPAPLGGTPRRFVETAGALRWSPDGSRIVYVRPGETRGDAIVVADANGGNPRDIVPARGGWHTHWPAWSADGQFVYFVRTIATWNGEPSEIVRVPAGGGAPQTVVRTTRRALFPLPTADGDLLYGANPNGVDLDLWWRRSSESEPQRLTTGVGEYAEPRMSADGRRLVSTLMEYRQALVSVPVAAAGRIPLQQRTDGFGGDLDPSVSPQTSRMVFSSSRSGNRNLWTADPDGSNIRPLTSDSAFDERPSFSPDGQQVAFVSDRGGQRGIWLVNSEGGALRRLASTPVLDTVTWSPDGQQIAHAVPAGTVPELSIIAVSDGVARKLPTPSGAHSPAWSPRGDAIAYLEPRGPGRTYLKFVNTRGEALYLTLPDGPAFTNGFLAWAPDGKRLAAVGVPGSANASIWIVEPDGSQPFRKLIELSGEASPRHHLDERRLVAHLWQTRSSQRPRVVRTARIDANVTRLLGRLRFVEQRSIVPPVERRECQAEHDVAKGDRQVSDAIPSVGPLLHPLGASTPAFTERGQSVGGRLVCCQRLAQHQRIFECHGRTLCHVGRCRVCRVANEHDAALNRPVDDDLLDRREMDRVDAPELAENAWHRFGEVRKERRKPSQVPIGRILSCGRREIRVAVETILCQGHRQEHAALAEHRGPGIYSIDVIDNEPPADLADIPRAGAVVEESSNGRVDPVGSDDEVIFVSRGIRKTNADLVVLLNERRHGGANTRRHAGGALEKHAMKVVVGNAHARADRVPDLREVDFRQLSSRVIQESLMGHAERSSP